MEKINNNFSTSKMAHHADYSNFTSQGSKVEALDSLVQSYEALSFSQTNWVSNLSNAASLIWHCYKSLNVDINWSGFYLKDADESLFLGPFMGKVACQQIKIGKGVCGTCASTLETQLVPNVEEFPGHIACDGETKSEIVVPIVQDGVIKAVIDIDCVDLNGFDEVDVKYLELLAAKISQTCVFSSPTL